MSLFTTGANMENEIEKELSKLYAESYYYVASPYVFGAYVSALKKRLKADLMISILYDIAKKKNRSHLSYIIKTL